MSIPVDTRCDIIHQKLSQTLSPTSLEVIDEGWQHIGHLEEGAGHFAIKIASPQFLGKSLVACHRMVYAALEGHIGNTIHALRIEIKKDIHST